MNVMLEPRIVATSVHRDADEEPIADYGPGIGGCRTIVGAQLAATHPVSIPRAARQSQPGRVDILRGATYHPDR